MPNLDYFTAQLVAMVRQMPDEILLELVRRRLAVAAPAVPGKKPEAIEQPEQPQPAPKKRRPKRKVSPAPAATVAPAKVAPVQAAPAAPPAPAKVAPAAAPAPAPAPAPAVVPRPQPAVPVRRERPAPRRAAAKKLAEAKAAAGVAPAPALAPETGAVKPIIRRKADKLAQSKPPSAPPKPAEPPPAAEAPEKPEAAAKRALLGQPGSEPPREDLSAAIEGVIRESDGVALADIAEAVGAPKVRVALLVRELKTARRIYQGGERRFARYASTAQKAEAASLRARKGD